MKQPAKFAEKQLVSWLLIALIFIAAAALLIPHHFALGLANYLPLHTAMEFFSIVVALLVFTVGINSYSEKVSTNLALLSSAFLAVGLLDFGHTLSYAGMPDFVTANSTEKAIYFWLAARMIAAVALLTVAVQPWQKELTVRAQAGFLAVGLTLSGFIYGIILFHQSALPQVFDGVTGLTPFKRAMEYLIVSIYATTTIIFNRRKQEPQPYDVNLLFAAVTVMGLGELFFAAYADVTDLPSLLGHVYKIIAYYLLYRAIFAHTIRAPYQRLSESERSLRESEERYRMIIETSAEGIWVLDQRNISVFANQKIAEMLGYAHTTQIIGHCVLDFMDEPDKILAANILQLHQQGISEQHEFRFRRRDGGELWAHISTSPIVQNGEYLGALEMVTDITERRRAAQKITELQYRNELILNAAGDGICGLSKGGLINFINPAAAKMLGYSVEELLGHSLHDISHHTKPDGSSYPASECPILGSLEHGAHYHEDGEFFLRRDGSMFPVEYTCTPVPDNSTEICMVVIFSDITERMRTADLISDLYNNAPNGYHSLDAQGLIVHINDTELAWLGYSRDEVVGKMAFPQLLTEESSWLFHETFPIYKKRGYVTNLNYEMVRKDGTIFPVLLSATAVRDEQGGYVMSRSVVTDMTEHHQAEKKLRDSEERFRTLFGSIQDAIFVLPVFPAGTSGNFIEVNEIASRMLGYSREQLLGMTIADVDDQDTGVDPAPIIQRLMAGESVIFEQVLRTKSGRRIPVEVNANPFLLAGQPVVMSLVRDISERKRTEAVLHWSEERFRSTFEQAAVGMAHAAPNGDFMRLNLKFCEIVGYPRAELMRMTFRDITFPDDLEKDNGYLRQALAGEISTFTMEKRYVRKEKTLVWVSLTVSLLRTADGAPNYFIAVIEDVTERKRAEQQLRELSAHLQTVREEEKANIAREIHDDLGGTLTALKMDLYWLARKLPAEKEMAPLQEHVESMSGLLDNAVTVTRRIITELRPSILDDLGLLAALEWQCVQFHKRTGIECRVNCIEDKGKLGKKHSITLFRILQEALTNVIRHSGASRVDIEFRNDDNTVTLQVRDNGCGLSKENHDNANRYGIRGMLERAISLGGRIDIESPPEGGLKITATLPLHNKTAGENT